MTSFQQVMEVWFVWQSAPASVCLCGFPLLTGNLLNNQENIKAFALCLNLFAHTHFLN